MEKIYVVYLKGSAVKLYETHELIDAEYFIHNREKELRCSDKYEIVTTYRRIV